LLKAEDLAGYVLEEILAVLLRDNGYRLLVDKRQDEEALDEEHHGLVVKGRGANHQVDALGQLLFSVPFSLPIRLFAEAKCKATSIGISDVRNAVGVISDVNERYAADGTYQFPLRRFHYRYALFSTSGFAPDAQKFALAHQISLIDLQGPRFSDLQVIAAGVANDLLTLAKSELEIFPLKQMREVFRRALGTWSFEDEHVGSSRKPSARARDLLPEKELRAIGEKIKEELEGKLILGFPQGPFVLVLQPDQLETFDEFLAGSASWVDADIKFASKDGVVGEWAIVPRSNPEAIARFGVPPLLEAWLLTDGMIDHDRVEQVKAELLSHIAVFHHGNNLTQFRYRKSPVAQSDVDIFDPAGSKLRRQFADADIAYWTRPQKQHHSDAVAGSPRESTMEDRFVPDIFHVAIGWPEYRAWTFDSASELLQRLSGRRLSWQIEVIQEAAAAGGWLSRGRILELSGNENPNLRNLVRPINDIVFRLKEEEIVEANVIPPLRRVRTKDRGVHYLIPSEFIEFLAPKPLGASGGR
jgi:hypothetical protein